MQVDEIGIYIHERGADVRLDLCSERSVTLSCMLMMGTSERRKRRAWCSYSTINSVYNYSVHGRPCTGLHASILLQLVSHLGTAAGGRHVLVISAFLCGTSRLLDISLNNAKAESLIQHALQCDALLWYNDIAGLNSCLTST